MESTNRRNCPLFVCCEFEFVTYPFNAFLVLWLSVSYNDNFRSCSKLGMVAKNVLFMIFY